MLPAGWVSSNHLHDLLLLTHRVSRVAMGLCLGRSRHNISRKSMARNHFIDYSKAFFLSTRGVQIVERSDGLIFSYVYGTATQKQNLYKKKKTRCFGWTSATTPILVRHIEISQKILVTHLLVHLKDQVGQELPLGLGNHGPQLQRKMVKQKSRDMSTNHSDI